MNISLQTIPRNLYITTGFGESNISQLNAFDNALENANIGHYNLVKVSSIVPPNIIIHDFKNIKLFPLPGSIVFTAYAKLTSSRENKLISAGVSIGIPIDVNSHGIIMEYEDFTNEIEIKDMLEKMVKEGMNNRNIEIKEITTKTVQYQVKKCGAVCAAIIMW